MSVPAFATLAAAPGPGLAELALALAAEFRRVDDALALAELERLGAELGRETCGSPLEQADACRLVLGERNGFVGNREEYDHPDNSMLDLVLERRTGLPIVLSVVYVEAARLAGIPAVRGDLGRAIHAAELRLALPVDDAARVTLAAELKALRARLN